ncbi:MAG: Ig-like domain-containing protein [Thermoleophilia bacterium]
MRRITRRSALALSATLLGMGAVASGAAAIGQLGFSGPHHHGDGGVHTAALGDIDGDGALDLVGATLAPGDRVAVLLGDGAGGFGPEVTYPAGVSASHLIAVDDFDGDGRADVAVGESNHLSGDKSIAILPGSAAGALGSPVAVDTGESSLWQLTSADANGDGAPELIAVVSDGSGNDSLRVLVNDGSGGFAPPLVYPDPAGALLTTPGVGDLNGDGDPDLVTPSFDASGAAEVSVRLGGPGATFSAPVGFPTGGVEVGSLAVGDRDGDGDQDVVVAHDTFASGDVRILAGDGTGALEASVLDFLLPSGSAGGVVALDDMDGDGRTDVVVSNDDEGIGGAFNTGDPTVSVRITGSGVFIYDVFSATGAAGALDVAVGDVDGDSRPDIATGGLGGSEGRFAVLLNDPSLARGALDDSYTTPENTTLVVPAPGVYENDTDGEGNPYRGFSLSVVEEPAHGTLTPGGDGLLAGSFSYTPEPGFSGTDSFTYAGFNTATVTITVEGTDDPPTAVDDPGHATIFGASLDVPAPGVLGNDTDPEEDPLTARLMEGPANGLLTLDPDGSFLYIPTGRDPSGIDTFTYVAVDPAGNESDPATVAIAVRANDPPVADDDAYTTPQDTPLVVPPPGVLDGDTDPDGDPLQLGGINFFDGPFHGTITALAADGSFTYVPDPGYSGPDSFVYSVSDPGLGDEGLVSITVTPAAQPAAVSVADAVPVEEGDTGTKAMRFTISRTGPTTQRARIVWHTESTPENGEAEGGVDYEARTTQATNIPIGATSATVTVKVIGDRVDEGDEALRVVLDSSTGAPIGDDVATGTIVDNDPPTLSVADVAIGEGNTGTKAMTFRVRLSRVWDAPVTVRWATGDGSATQPGDYLAASGELVIPAGSRRPIDPDTGEPVEAVVRVVGDRAAEPEEAFSFVLSDASGAVIGDGEAVGTIRDND